MNKKLEDLIPKNWRNILNSELNEEYWNTLTEKVDDEYNNQTIFPQKKDLFRALELTKYKDVKVILLGQDPYHNDNQAHGLSFSVLPGIKTPPSLRNIYKELNTDLNCEIPNNGYLEKWAKQGVLLLNAILTVRKSEAASHKKLGWEKFTDQIIKKLNERKEPVIFLLFGNFAKKKKKLITNKQHIIFEEVHPSPLSANRGFFGSKVFSRINEQLIKLDYQTIDWQIENI